MSPEQTLVRNSLEYQELLDWRKSFYQTRAATQSLFGEHLFTSALFPLNEAKIAELAKEQTTRFSTSFMKQANSPAINTNLLDQDIISYKRQAAQNWRSVRSFVLFTNGKNTMYLRPGLEESDYPHEFVHQWQIENKIMPPLLMGKVAIDLVCAESYYNNTEKGFKTPELVDFIVQERKRVQHLFAGEDVELSLIEDMLIEGMACYVEEMVTSNHEYAQKFDINRSIARLRLVAQAAKSEQKLTEDRLPYALVNSSPYLLGFRYTKQWMQVNADPNRTVGSLFRQMWNTKPETLENLKVCF